MQRALWVIRDACLCDSHTSQQITITIIVIVIILPKQPLMFVSIPKTVRTGRAANQNTNGTVTCPLRYCPLQFTTNYYF